MRALITPGTACSSSGRSAVGFSFLQFTKNYSKKNESISALCAYIDLGMLCLLDFYPVENMAKYVCARRKKQLKQHVVLYGGVLLCYIS